MAVRSAEQVLRAKYLDWCSARLAASFLALRPDEIYELAERGSGGAASDRDWRLVASGAGTGTDRGWDGLPFELAITSDVARWQIKDSESFRALVTRVTEVLADQIQLPDFETWRMQYEQTPEHFDDELLGLWKEAIEEE